MTAGHVLRAHVCRVRAPEQQARLDAVLATLRAAGVPLSLRDLADRIAANDPAVAGLVGTVPPPNPLRNYHARIRRTVVSATIDGDVVELVNADRAHYQDAVWLYALPEWVAAGRVPDRYRYDRAANAAPPPPVDRA